MTENTITFLFLSQTQVISKIDKEKNNNRIP